LPSLSFARRRSCTPALTGAKRCDALSPKQSRGRPAAWGRMRSSAESRYPRKRGPSDRRRRGACEIESGTPVRHGGECSGGIGRSPPSASRRACARA
jgi:hypothetical protein